jgi:hypothetical protein
VEARPGIHGACASLAAGSIATTRGRRTETAKFRLVTPQWSSSPTRLSPNRLPHARTDAESLVCGCLTSPILSTKKTHAFSVSPLNWSANVERIGRSDLSALPRHAPLPNDSADASPVGRCPTVTGLTRLERAFAPVTQGHPAIGPYGRCDVRFH